MTTENNQIVRASHGSLAPLTSQPVVLNPTGAIARVLGSAYFNTIENWQVEQKAHEMRTLQTDLAMNGALTQLEQFNEWQRLNGHTTNASAAWTAKRIDQTRQKLERH